MIRGGMKTDREELDRRKRTDRGYGDQIVKN